MKKILIISYHTLPLDIIASYRTQSYIDHFHKHDIFPTVVTHDWSSPMSEEGTNPSNAIKIEENEQFRIIRLPGFNDKVRYEEAKRLPESKVKRQLKILTNLLQGNFELELLKSYHIYRKFLFQHLKEETYDMVLGISSPQNHLKLCYEIHKKFDIPYVLDFRDLWNNRIIHKGYKPSPQERFIDQVSKIYWKKWLKKAAFFSITSQPWCDKVKEFTSTPGVVITNGFEENLFKEVAESAVNQETFKIIHTGSLYHHQKLEIGLEGVQKFIEKHQPEDFKLIFLGAKRGTFKKYFNGFLSNPEQLIYRFIPENYCEVEGRLPRKEVLHALGDAHVLWFPSFPDAPGTYAGKIFEYLGAQRNILSFPSDHSVVDELLHRTKAGKVCDSSDDVASTIENHYFSWKKNKARNYGGSVEMAMKYSRGYQAKKMSEYIHKALETDNK